MTVAVQAAHDTAPVPVGTGPLTVPLQIIAAAGARHRAARAEHRSLPGWALLVVTAAVPALLALAVFDWRGLVSVALIAMTLVGAGCAFALDLVGMLEQTPAEEPAS